MSDARSKLTKAGVSVIDGKIKPSDVDTAVRVLIASDESIDAGLNQLRNAGYKICSAFWTGSSDNVYLSYIAIKDPTNWNSHKPFGTDGLFGLYYCYAGDISEFPSKNGTTDMKALENGISRIAKKHSITDLKAEQTGDGIIKFTFSDSSGLGSITYDVRSTDSWSDDDHPVEEKIIDDITNLADDCYRSSPQFLGAPSEVPNSEVIGDAQDAPKLSERIESILSGKADNDGGFRSE
jgi:hypothetical protein